MNCPRKLAFVGATGLLLLGCLDVEATGASTTTVVSARTGSTTVVAPLPGNPFASPAIVGFLRSRTSNVTAALYDPSTKRTYLYRANIDQAAASMVKIDILSDLLFEAQLAHRVLDSTERTLAATMVEDSGNVAAQRLWNDAGGFGLSARTRGTGGYYAISSFNQRVGFDQTETNWAWGLMETTPSDFLKLLAAIWLPRSLLSRTSQAYEQSLMENVLASQRFGIANGVPAGAVVGIKDGWYPESSGWQVNSAGYVHLGRVTYLAVIMSGENPDESYGINTVNILGTLLWRFESGTR